jgi:lipoyl-dependent peroxiredoxin
LTAAAKNPSEIVVLEGDEGISEFRVPRREVYTAEVAVKGGRSGHAKSSDSSLDVDLVVPKEQGGPGGAGTNPEQLFAAGFAACFESAIMGAGRRFKVPIEEVTINSRVGIGPTVETAFGLTVELRVRLPGVDKSVAQSLIIQAERNCPYAIATLGNIPVRLILEPDTPYP